MHSLFGCITIVGLLSFWADSDVVNEPMCFYNKKQELILFIEGENFLLVNTEILMGTKYLLAEKGFIRKENKERMTLMIAATANFEADSINSRIVEELADPLPLDGVLSRKGVSLSSRGTFLKACSCQKDVFGVVERLAAFYPTTKP